jgi:alpha-ribazole phosphatase
MNLPEQGPATRIVLVRHTEPVEEARGRCYGRSDVGLSDAGHLHAAKLASQLSDLPIAAVVASPRQRALDTAAPIAAHHDLAVETVPGLRELDFGEIEGKTYEEIERSRPDLWRRWMSEPTAVHFPGGEGYADLRERVVAATGDLQRAHDGKVCVVVTHGGVIRAVLSAALELPDAKIFRFDQSYGALSVIDWFDGTPVIRLVNG